MDTHTKTEPPYRLTYIAEKWYSDEYTPADVRWLIDRVQDLLDAATAVRKSTSKSKLPPVGVLLKLGEAIDKANARGV